MTLYKWSQTASADATADSTINWAEGQSPSSINDSARAMMAALAKYRDDTCGANNGTGGTSTAYNLASNQVFDSTAHMAAQELTIYFHATNGASPTLNVDGLGAFPIVMDGAGTVVPAGTLIAGTPYELAFNNSSSHWRLKNFYQLPFTIPVGGVIDYFGSSSPNSAFVLPSGQAVSRTTYATLFSLFGTTYGSGDGSTTFNVPDLRGRVVAGKDDMGGSAASRLSGTSITTGGGATTLGGSGGAETKTLLTANLPPYTPAGTFSGTGLSIPSLMIGGTTVISIQGAGGGSILGFGVNTSPTYGQLTSNVNGSISGSAQGGTSTPLAVTQPTIIANKLLRII